MKDILAEIRQKRGDYYRQFGEYPTRVAVPFAREREMIDALNACALYLSPRKRKHVYRHSIQYCGATVLFTSAQNIVCYDERVRQSDVYRFAKKAMAQKFVHKECADEHSFVENRSYSLEKQMSDVYKAGDMITVIKAERLSSRTILGEIKGCHAVHAPAGTKGTLLRRVGLRSWLIMIDVAQEIKIVKLLEQEFKPSPGRAREAKETAPSAPTIVDDHVDVGRYVIAVVKQSEKTRFQYATQAQAEQAIELLQSKNAERVYHVMQCAARYVPEQHVAQTWVRSEE